MRRLVALLSLALVASGCLLPDRARLDAGPEDAGPEDASRGDAGDGGDVPDAGDGGGCEVVELFERTCEGGRDEDCDGLVDCNDFDCGRELACCGAGGERVVSEFESASFEWISLPSGLVPAIEPELGVVRTFYTGEPRALRYAECLPVDLGVEITATLRAPRAAPCEDGAPCPYAAIVLTPTREMARGVPLPDELSVRLYGDRRLEVRRAGTRLDHRVAPFGIDDVTITIQLTPGVDDHGRSWVYASVRAAQTGVATWHAFDADGRKRALVPREDLVGAALGCEETRGLFLAIEGIGAQVDVDSVAIEPFECANPSNFSALREDELDLGALPGWTAGGVGAPALGSYFLGASSGAWDLYYDATNVARTNELVAPVRFAIGLSSTGDRDGVAAWMTRNGGAPVVGVAPPQCSGAGCPEPSSVREPSLYVPLDETTRRVATGTFGWVAYARELEDGGARRFGLEMSQVTFSPPAVGATFPLLTPEDEGGGCTSLRDPLLLPIGPAPTSDFWLLYGCEQGGRLRTIRGARVSTEPDVTTVPLDAPLLDHTQLGSIASITLRGADGAAWFPAATEAFVYRLWVVTRDISARTAVAFAEAAGERGDVPRFVPYAANPVLRSTDAVLGPCAGTRCDIEAIAVSRIANAPQRVRLVVSRTITSSTDVRHVLVPLDQVWPR